MTPRQLAGTLYFARRRQMRQRIEFLSVSSMAARGKPENVRKTLREWERLAK